MLPIGGRPLLQHTIEGLKHAGVRHVHITTHHLSEKITEHFGDGSSFGVALHYLNEDSPLGTAGGLRLLGEQAEAFLVINGDILTTLDFRAALAFHREHKAQLTVGVRPYDVRIPYGVVRSAGAQVLGVDEKPTITTLVNAGVYIVEPDVLQHIPQNLHFDMTDLIESLLAVGKTVVSFPILEYWRDIGHPLDYEQAQSDIKSGVAAR
jgi:NDP-sugar pyrophosphorylase family protein